VISQSGISRERQLKYPNRYSVLSGDCKIERSYLTFESRRTTSRNRKHFAYATANEAITGLSTLNRRGSRV
jgi:hypothetical protein